MWVPKHIWYVFGMQTSCCFLHTSTSLAATEALGFWGRGFKNQQPIPSIYEQADTSFK